MSTEQEIKQIAERLRHLFSIDNNAPRYVIEQGIFGNRALEEFEDKIGELEDTIEEHEDTIEELEGEVKKLKEKIAELEESDA